MFHCIFKSTRKKLKFYFLKESNAITKLNQFKILLKSAEKNSIYDFLNLIPIMTGNFKLWSSQASCLLIWADQIIKITAFKPNIRGKTLNSVLKIFKKYKLKSLVYLCMYKNEKYKNACFFIVCEMKNGCMLYLTG